MHTCLSATQQQNLAGGTRHDSGLRTPPPNLGRELRSAHLLVHLQGDSLLQAAVKHALDAHLLEHGLVLQSGVAPR
eukprot:CAMPEP_0115482276 /NCGR_PEP_ID=MMETSP0271-20121206/58243_1 /TAXON_ID=71861 /ORGANISM="Scrippsiella trochoidea, Strain CCMP3099" /LENGTH=75 /DNA_ID=CAMNT_0002910063 /DNA_START=101 /DNA_END=325 /DNA_ORIENTATION=+